MVMRFFRKRYEVIIWTVIVVFLLGFVVLSSVHLLELRKDALFRIGNTRYSALEYYNRLEKAFQFLRREERQIDEQQLKNDVLDGFISESVLLRFAQDINIEVSREQIKETIESQNVFFEGGSFSRNRYLDLLEANNLDERTYENSIKLQLLIQHLSGMIQNSNVISPLYMNEINRLEGLNYNISWLIMDINKLRDAIDISDDSIQQHYSDNMEEFFVKPEIRIIYRNFPINPLEDSNETIISQLKEITKQVKDGKITFEDAAKIYSDGPSGPRGGDLGWFDEETMVPEFTEVVFNMKKGDISEPFKTKFGYHIAFVEDTKTENGKKMIKARHILMEIKISDDEKENIYSDVLNIYSQLSRGEKLKDLYNDCMITDWLDEKELPYSQMSDIFEFRGNESGYPFFISEKENEPAKYILYQVYDKKDGYYKKLEDIADIIKKEIFIDEVKKHLKNDLGAIVNEDMEWKSSIFYFNEPVIIDIFGKVDEEKEAERFNELSDTSSNIKKVLDTMQKNELGFNIIGDNIYVFRLLGKGLENLSTEFQPDIIGFFQMIYSSSMFGEFLKYLRDKYKVKVNKEKIGL